MRHLLVAAVIACLLAACGKGGAPSDATAKAGESGRGAVLLLAPEDLRTVGAADAAAGAVITGTVQPERRADLRAEVSAVVLQVFKENGEPVKGGELLVRLDDTSIRDTLASADESARASGQAFEQAERQVQRLKTLQAQGMTSMQALEDAEVRRNNAQSDLVAARARVVAARQQLRRTEVRAPFDGVVSDRKVSAGDTAQIGKELLKVIDPRSMRFEGLVSADRMHEIRIGQEVRFRVNGYATTEFAGKVRRVDAAANSTTRQVEVLVDFVEPAGAPRVAGLYAEGRIASGGKAALTLPEASVTRVGDKPFVWRVNAKDKTLAKVPVQLGERDARRGEYALQSGLTEGDRILRNPGGTLVDGQRFEFASAAANGAAPAASTGS
ncbi:MAG TPA: efflux RND transporter periplasmic adaptor subunit [Albitalea sp.]|uniref:efflux RND transporter periplasmic adaptor subunit n=1 Tax=Piscinibacter sp. TaxID=1903157 RepID=UPI002ED50117